MNKIEEFLIGQEAKNTVTVYKSHLKHYYTTLNLDWDNPDSYFDNGRDYEEDFKDYAYKIKDFSPCTRSARLNCVKIFLEENDIVLSKKILKKTTRKVKHRPITIDEIPKPRELKSILSHGTAKDRALFLLLSSSGIRINEALSLEPDDIKWDYDPMRVYIRAETTKNNIPRIAFISNECKEALMEWLKERNDWLRVAVKRTKKIYRKDGNDTRIFPFQYNVAIVSWHRLLRKSKYIEKDKSTGRHRFHIHVLRKYFITRLKQDVKEAIVEKIAGHEGYLAGAYNKLTVEELEEGYKKGVKNLLIFQTESEDVSDIREQLKEKDTMIQKQQGQIEKLLQAQQAMELKMDIIENRLELEKLKNGKK